MKSSVILYKKIAKDLRERLEQHVNLIELEGFPAYDHPALAQAEGIIGAGGKVNGEFLQHAPALRVVSTISVGYDTVDIDALTEKGIALMHTPTVLTDTVADTVLALMLASARRVVEVANKVKAGQWKESIGSDWFGTDVHHKTLGILGMGRIGMAVAQRAHLGFNMSVLYHARSRHEQAESRFNARYCSLDTLLAESDFLCVTLPLTAQTRHMVGREQLEKMKSSAILINIGRGDVIDEGALIEALQNGTIKAAGLDVFAREPLALDSPLLRMENVVAVPHIGSATHETRYGMAACAVDNLIAALTGKVQKNCVNPQVFIDD